MLSCQKWHAKNFDVMCDFLFGNAKQEITFCHITPKMLTSCLCNGGLSKNIISQSDHSTHVTCNVACLVKNDHQDILIKEH
jgi:hypothetical protein